MDRHVAPALFFLLLFLIGSCGGGGSDGGATYFLGGQITENGEDRQNVTVTLTGDASGTTQTDSGGLYIFTGLSSGSYTVACSLYGQPLTPAQMPVVILDSDSPSNDFTLDIYPMCGACHGVPPLTGSHLAHYGGSASDATYSGTGSTGDILPGGDVYAFDCGNCHPLDLTRHINEVPNSGGGMAEVELTGSGAPSDSMKLLNTTGASYSPGSTIHVDSDGFNYTEGTCDGVYCHSYLEFNDTVLRINTSPKWGDTSLSCNGCHGIPTRTYYPTVPAGGGDSHSWISNGGGERLHGGAHATSPIACATCHYATVTEQGTRTRDSSGWSIYDPVPIADHSAHVNGDAEVLFTVDIIAFTSTYNLSSAGYDTTTRTCTNVSCHLKETTIQWGTPLDGNECSDCHFG